MKLRSGTALASRHATLPPVLEAELDSRLLEYKKQFSSNITHAKELLKIVSEALNGEWRWPIKAKIEEIYDDNNFPNGTAPLKSAAGSLAWLVAGIDRFYTENHIQPEYHDLIQAKISHFDLETPLVGNTEN